jgi:hypothetical protein
MKLLLFPLLDISKMKMLTLLNILMIILFQSIFYVLKNSLPKKNIYVIGNIYT